MPRNSWRTALAKLECGIVWWPAPLFQSRYFVGVRVSVHERALHSCVARSRCLSDGLHEGVHMRARVHVYVCVFCARVCVRMHFIQ